MRNRFVGTKGVPKYRNKITEVDGIKFHSMAEAKRYQDLKLMERCGDVRRLELQPRFDLIVNGEKICVYVGDFRYEWKWYSHTGAGEWKDVVEDVKGVRTPAYNIKRKLMKAIHGIEIQEIGGSRRATRGRKSSKAKR